MNDIVANHLAYRFPNAPDDALRDVSWEIAEGSATLVVGATGAGKSTLLRCLNGLIPHFHGGNFGGTVSVLGTDTRFAAPRDLAHVVGMVFQDPESQFVTDHVEDEIVFGMENLGYDRRTMRIRLEETLDLLGINHLRDRDITSLSGGERQRVAIAAALVTRPRVLVLDEPTSQLDPLAAHDVLAAVARLNSDLAITVVIAEHRLDRVLPFVDRIASLDAGTFVEEATQNMLPSLDDVPPLVEYARRRGWWPLPLTVRDARQHLSLDWSPSEAVVNATRSRGDEILRVEGVDYLYGTIPALRDVNLAGYSGEVIALIGRNGSGKTTLLKQINGLLRPERGQVLHRGSSISRQPVYEIARTTGYVPQHPTAILHQETLGDELVFTTRAQSICVDPAPLLARLNLLDKIDRHPLDLSGGERQRAALAAILIAQPDILLLDEPTRGLPARDKRWLAKFIREYASAGRLVMVATHDVEFVAHAADRVLMLAEGEIIADGPPEQVLAGSLAFGTQMNRLFGGTILTVEDALELLIPLA